MNSGEIERAAAVLGEFVVWMRDNEPSYWGREGNKAAAMWAKRVSQERAALNIIPDNCQIFGDLAFCRGWETLEIPGRDRLRFRYFQIWERSATGWKLTSCMSNKDVEPKMLGD